MIKNSKIFKKIEDIFEFIRITITHESEYVLFRT